LRTGIKKQICTHFKQNEIHWQFNPPQASNMGGIWERLIRLIRIVNRMFDESFARVLLGVEAIVNSRLLTPVVFDTA